MVVALVLLTGGWSAEQLGSLADRLNLNRPHRKILVRAMKEARGIVRSLASGRRLRPERVYSACRNCHRTSISVARLMTRSQKTVSALNAYQTDDYRGICDINGDDLIAAGIPEGAAIKIGLEAAAVAKLKGEAETRGAQLEVALREARACLTYLPGFD
jgi:hypothetical protein